jgi:hypothetical protein
LVYSAGLTGYVGAAQTDHAVRLEVHILIPWNEPR